MKRTIIILAATLLSAPIASQADPIGTTQTFNGDPNLTDTPDGCIGCLVNGWFGEFVPDVGQDGAGDNALLLDFGLRDNGEPFGFHLATFLGFDGADEAFLGNLLAAGVLGVQFDAWNDGGSDLFLRAYIFDDFGVADEFFGSTYSSTGAEIFAETGWTTYTILFSSSDLLLSPDNTDPDQTAADILSDVWQFGLRHDPGGQGPGFPDPVVARVYFDNLRLLTVPEPGTLALLGIGLFGTCLARRRKKI